MKKNFCILLMFFSSCHLYGSFKGFDFSRYKNLLAEENANTLKAQESFSDPKLLLFRHKKALEELETPSQHLFYMHLFLLEYKGRVLGCMSEFINSIKCIHSERDEIKNFFQKNSKINSCYIAQILFQQGINKSVSMSHGNKRGEIFGSVVGEMYAERYKIIYEKNQEKINENIPALKEAFVNVCSAAGSSYGGLFRLELIDYIFYEGDSSENKAILSYSQSDYQKKYQILYEEVKKNIKSNMACFSKMNSLDKKNLENDLLEAVNCTVRKTKENFLKSNWKSEIFSELERFNTLKSSFSCEAINFNGDINGKGLEWKSVFVSYLGSFFYEAKSRGENKALECLVQYVENICFFSIKSYFFYQGINGKNIETAKEIVAGFSEDLALKMLENISNEVMFFNYFFPEKIGEGPSSRYLLNFIKLYSEAAILMLKIEENKNF